MGLHSYVIERHAKSKWRNETDHILLQLHANKNILAFEKMFEAIKNWQRDYSKVVCALKKAFIKMIYRQNKPSVFLKSYPQLFLKAV